MSIETVGPIEETYVLFDGRCVPFLRLHGDGALSLDGRMGLDTWVWNETNPNARDALIEFIANAMALGMGYASFPREGAEPTPMPAFPRWHGLSFDHPDLDTHTHEFDDLDGNTTR